MLRAVAVFALLLPAAGLVTSAGRFYHQQVPAKTGDRAPGKGYTYGSFKANSSTNNDF